MLLEGERYNTNLTDWCHWDQDLSCQLNSKLRGIGTALGGQKNRGGEFAAETSGGSTGFARAIFVASHLRFVLLEPENEM